MPSTHDIVNILTKQERKSAERKLTMYTLHVVLITRPDDNGTPQDSFAFIGFHSLSTDFDYVNALPHVDTLNPADNPRVDWFDFDYVADLMQFVRGASRNSGLSLLNIAADATRAANGNFVWRDLF
jgi:hypothetical protein